MGKKEQKEMLNMKLAEKIYQERRKLGLSQEQFAEQMDISRQAVSKWESGQSMPDLDKIVAMSQIFGVTTDYLLKEEDSSYNGTSDGMNIDYYNETSNGNNIDYIYSEIPDEKYSDSDNYNEKSTYTERTQKENKVSQEPLKTIDSEEIASYQKVYTSATKSIALGVFLCIFGCMLTSGAEALSFAFVTINDDALEAFPLFICVTIAIALFVPSGMALSKYEYLQKVAFVLPESERMRLEEESDAFDRKFATGITAGIVLILMGVLAGAAMEYITVVTSNAIWDETISGMVLLTCVACGVYLFIRCGMKKGFYNVLLQKEEYSVGKKQRDDKKNELMGMVSGVYWCLVTAGFLGYSFLTEDWGRSWIVWPVAGCIFGAIATFIALYNGKDKVNN